MFDRFVNPYVLENKIHKQCKQSIHVVHTYIQKKIAHFNDAAAAI